ncbi:MAG TPA: response regulator [Chitinophagaceae bacterium]|jgi:two-component system LytT family response regulator|nr:response regulator [Chitinophagaceae bacterium]
MTAIIVDDEKHCREVLEHLLHKHCSNIKIIASCASGDEALSALTKQQPDILFLDIEMPGMNGFELLDNFHRPEFEIVFTTAYNEYAIKAIKHSALDYLLKPVDKDELLQTIERVKEQKVQQASKRVDNLLEILNIRKKTRRFAVPTMEGLIMVDPETILYCESDSAYCKLVFIGQERPLVISKTLKDVEEVLQGDEFCRIHHSYLINMRCVQRYIRGEGGEVIMNNGAHLPVSRSRKQDFLSLLEKI